jgi:hypothetical protein
VLWDRVMGELAVSRAIGDEFLRPYVIADPEVRRSWSPCAPPECCAQRPPLRLPVAFPLCTEAALLHEHICPPRRISRPC